MPIGEPCVQLNALLKRDPTAADREAVAAHIASCPFCQKIVAGSLATVDFQSAQTATDLPWKVIDETVSFEGDRLRIAGSREPALAIQVPGYQVLSELGRGGMGIVYKARQLSLDRLVALKMIRSAVLADTNQLARFNTEAAALAQLQHPNIVQVFAIGQHEDMPYLSMEFVAGETLSAVIERGSFSPREAAAMVEKLARAMYSAHQRGVLHRDLKPSNILLAADGEPKITDFGLAKRVGDASHVTVDQTVMGTPSYMPPEQALGNIAEVGPRSDVYSLGAILYELLTGRPPFRGSTPMETIQQVIQREPIAPRTINQRTPRDLETICLKCLHKVPEQRFETAADLADDLRRFQKDEPILARRISLLGRSWRWCRRNPALSTAIMAVCLVGVLGIGGVVWQSSLTDRALSLAQQQFRRYSAESAEKLSLIQDLMERVPEEERAHDRRLQAALASYETWLAEEPADASALSSYADALFRVAEIRRRIGQFDLAEELYVKARDRYQQLAAAAPQDLSHLHGMAETLNWLGENYRAQGALEKAIHAYEQALEQQSKLVARSKPDPFQGADVARLLYNRALARFDLKRHAEAEADLRQSIELLDRSLQKRPQEAAFRQGLARSRINLGIVLRATDRSQAANDQYLAAIDLLKGLEEQDPRNTDYRLELAMALMNRANLLLADHPRNELLADPLEAAEQTYRESVDKLRALAAEYSNVPRYRKELANSLNGLGAALSQRAQTAAAERAWLEAVAELKGLVERSPDVAEYLGLLAQTSHNLAYLHRDDSDTTRLESFLREAVDRQRKASLLSPSNVSYSRTLRNYERSLARVLVDRGKYAEAAAVAEQLAASSADDPRLLYSAARILAECAVTAEKVSSGKTEPAGLSQRLRQHATTLIATCRQHGLAIKPEDFPGIETMPR